MRRWWPALATLALLAGCTQPITAPPRDVSAEGTSSVEASIGVGLGPDDPAVPHQDVNGRLPEDVVLELVAARNASDWPGAYMLYAAPQLDYESAVREWDGANEHLRYFTVHETRVIDADTAVVRVTYSAEGRTHVVIRQPGEWWALSLVDGAWKVDWLPRQ